MSAEEKVFSIPDLRLYILQFAIENKEKKQEECKITIFIRKIKNKINNSMLDCGFSILYCLGINTQVPYIFYR
tara:strand:- start:1788 stop:2006 length:219 start_codon:yes stop_codon:yes gene_type:complete